MAKITELDLAKLNARHFKRAFYVKRTMQGLAVQAMPKPYKRPAISIEWNTRFGIAARMASNAISIELASAIGLSKGTTQVPRDLLTMAATGRLWQIEMPDGSILGHVEGPTVPVPQPITGDLRMWEWFQWSNMRSTAYPTGNYPSRGMQIIPKTDNTIKGIRANINGVAGAQYVAFTATLKTPTTINEPTYGDTITITSSGNQIIELPISAPIKAATPTLVMIARTDAGDTSNLPLPFPAAPQWGHTSTVSNGPNIAKALPHDGDTVVFGGTNGATMAILFEID
jgi:hypothetical protein